MQPVPCTRPQLTLQQQESLRRILVIRRGGIGDIILTTPSLRLLTSKLPGARVDMLVQQGASEAISGLPYVERVLEVDTRSNLFSLVRLFRLSRQLRGNGYDLLINYQPGLKTNFLTRSAQPRFTLTFAKDRSLQARTARVRHAIDDFAYLLRPLSIAPLSNRTLDFAIPEAARARLSLLLEEVRPSGADSAAPLIVVNPTARRLVNRWPVSRWAQLIDALLAKGEYRVAVTGAGLDIGMVRAVAARSRHWNLVLNLAGRISLKELGALLERADAFVTADSGPMHVGAAVGVPLVCLSGAADPDRTGPLTSNCVVLIDRSLPCVPCRNKRCRHASRPICMDGISIEQVVRATRHVIGGKCRVPLSVVQV